MILAQFNHYFFQLHWLAARPSDGDWGSFHDVPPGYILPIGFPLPSPEKGYPPPQIPEKEDKKQRQGEEQSAR